MEAWIIAGLILFLLLVNLLVLLSLKGNKNSEEILRKQSVVIVELTEEVKTLQENVEECCLGKKSSAKKAEPKKVETKKEPAKKAPAKKVEPKKEPAKKAPAKKATVKKT